MMGHPHGVLVGAVVKAADVAWGAFERLRPQKESDPVRDRCLQLQRAIHCQRSDNQRLGDALDTIQSLQKDVTSQSEGCPSDLYERLMKIVESPAFLEKLQNFHGNGKEKIGGPAIMDDEGVALVNTDAEDPSCWLWVMDDFVPNKGEEQCGLDNENYMIISQEDIVDGIAVFMAKYVASSPQAKSLSPEELQMTISREFATMDQMKIIKKLWVVGKYVYIAASWGLMCMGFSHMLLS